MYRGTVKNGVVVIDGEVSLKEGARVTIEEEPKAPGVPRAGSPQALLRAAGKWPVRRGNWADCWHNFEK